MEAGITHGNTRPLNNAGAILIDVFSTLPRGLRCPGEEIREAKQRQRGVTTMRDISPPRLRERLLAGERLLGSFLKTPTPHATEILGSVGFDFVVNRRGARADRPGRYRYDPAGRARGRHRSPGEGAILSVRGNPLCAGLRRVGCSGPSRGFGCKSEGGCRRLPLSQWHARVLTFGPCGPLWLGRAPGPYR